MFCPKCGAQIDDNSVFCPSCGAQLGSMTQPGTTQPQGTAPQAGLQKNVAGLLCYLAGWITGIIFLVIEKDRFVRFHAWQSILVSGAITVLEIFLAILTPLLWRLFIIISLLSTIVGIATFVIWILCMIKAYQGQYFKLPIAGPMAEKLANK